VAKESQQFFGFFEFDEEMTTHELRKNELTKIGRVD